MIVVEVMSLSLVLVVLNVFRFKNFKVYKRD